MARRILLNPFPNLLLILAWWAGPAWAQEAPVPPGLPGDGMGLPIAKMLMALALVLALVMGLYLLARRFLPGNAGAGPAGGMRLLGRLPLGPRKWLALVEVGGKAHLLGVADQSINLLATLDDPDQVERLAQARPSFSGLLKRAQGERKETQP